MTDLLAIQKNGANARARRESLFDNPYLKSANMPAATGCSLQEWVARLSNWEIGWRTEDLISQPGTLTESILAQSTTLGD